MQIKYQYLDSSRKFVAIFCVAFCSEYGKVREQTNDCVYARNACIKLILPLGLLRFNLSIISTVLVLSPLLVTSDQEKFVFNQQHAKYAFADDPRFKVLIE